jgi:cytochrome c2
MMKHIISIILFTTFILAAMNCSPGEQNSSPQDNPDQTPVVNNNAPAAAGPSGETDPAVEPENESLLEGSEVPGENASELDPEVLLQEKLCTTCHTFTEDRVAGQIGPALYGVYMSEVTLTDGSVITADEDYLRESLKDPGAKLVEGYANLMAPAPLTDEEIDVLVDYLMKLGR